MAKWNVLLSAAPAGLVTWMIEIHPPHVAPPPEPVPLPGGGLFFLHGNPQSLEAKEEHGGWGGKRLRKKEGRLSWDRKSESLGTEETLVEGKLAFETARRDM